jgi:enoyl-CoA hydratase/carnithine racemase
MVLELQVRDRVAWLTLDRPERSNALPRGFWRELTAAVAAVDTDPEARVAVLSGAGPCFCSGGDLDGLGALGDLADRRAYMDEALAAFRRLDELSKPTIAAVHGHALGGGCELTMVCDIVVADRTARFGLPEANVGLTPGLAVVRGGAHLHLHWLKYMIFTGRSLEVEEARLAGLVNVVTDEGEHLVEAGRLAALIAAKAPLALQVGKRLVYESSPERYGNAAEAVAKLQGTDDFAEGVAAFGEGRVPGFRGR